jgi:hypothetical protein
MERLGPVARSDEIDLYVRTYTSLLRSSGRVRVRAFEEAHAFSASSLHEGALKATPDVSAFAYAAARLPDVMPDIELVVLGQSHELFEAAGFDVKEWKQVRTRGRRRPARWDGGRTLATFIASVSDIDDLIPILTAYQIEWNKMHARLRGRAWTTENLAAILDVPPEAVDTLRQAFGPARFEESMKTLATRPLDVSVQMLAASYSQYQKAAERWWRGVEPMYLRQVPPKRPPIYFVSSNTHAIANLVGGYGRANKDAILAYGEAGDIDGLAPRIREARAGGDEIEQLSLAYYLLRSYIHAAKDGRRMREARDYEKQTGLIHVSEPGHVDVDAQLVELARLDPARLDPRLDVPGIEKLRYSDAVIVNIDYPLGMAAYHLLSRVGLGVGEVRGVYVMGKAATLNGRVGDVALASTAYDEHTQTTFMLRNAFGAKDVSPYLRYGSVFDHQAALTVRSAFLQNRNYLGSFYKDGYTVLEMEAGPFLCAAYELVSPTRVPRDEIVNLTEAPFEIGFLHYASDTPYSRRQSLLSKALGFFGVDSTYACAVAIVRRILEREIARVG